MLNAENGNFLFYLHAATNFISFFFCLFSFECFFYPPVFYIFKCKQIKTPAFKEMISPTTNSGSQVNREDVKKKELEVLWESSDQ